MEILVGLVWSVVEFFAELLLQLVIEVLAEAGVRVARRPVAGSAPVRAWLAVPGYLVLGALAGALSLWLFPQLFIPSQVGRIACLLLVPVASGAAMAALGAWRMRHAQGLVGLDRFAYGFLFALAMSGVRYAFGR